MSSTTTTVNVNNVIGHLVQVDDDDYEEPVWQGGKIDRATSNPVDMDELLVAASQKRIKLMAERREKVYDALARYEPLWVFSKDCPVSEVMGGFLQMLSGDPEPCQLVARCQELYLVERVMEDCISWITYESEYLNCFNQMNLNLKLRCQSVRTSVRYHRQSIMSISNSIAYKYKDCREEYLVDDRFVSNQLNNASVRTPSIEAVASPDHMDDDLIRNARVKFDHFVKAIGRSSNGKKDVWNIKANEVKRLETFMRKCLAVNSESFCFLDKECFHAEDTRRLSTHAIWWKHDEARHFQKIPWVKLLKSSMPTYLGVLSKDRTTFKKLLNVLVEKDLYPDSTLSHDHET